MAYFFLGHVHHCQFDFPVNDGFGGDADNNDDDYDINNEKGKTQPIISYARLHYFPGLAANIQIHRGDMDGLEVEHCATVINYVTYCCYYFCK